MLLVIINEIHISVYTKIIPLAFYSLREIILWFYYNTLGYEIL